MCTWETSQNSKDALIYIVNKNPISLYYLLTSFPGSNVTIVQIVGSLKELMLRVEQNIFLLLNNMDYC